MTFLKILPAIFLVIWEPVSFLEMWKFPKVNYLEEETSTKKRRKTPENQLTIKKE